MNYKDAEGRRHDLFKVLFWYLPGGNEENYESRRIIDVCVEIRSRDFSNTSQKFYRRYGYVTINLSKPSGNFTYDQV
jgi:hypothetical protein